ncbi:MAG: hypothetical protein ABSE95_17730 [Thermodesulfobacteriota bacterium]
MLTSGGPILVVTLISAGSPSLAGLIYDATGSYQIPWFIALAVLLAGILIALMTRPPQRELGSS